MESKASTAVVSERRGSMSGGKAEDETSVAQSQVGGLGYTASDVTTQDATPKPPFFDTCGHA
jgi:hypothetical protein